LELGLIKKSSEGSYYDLFRNRIIFPIRNEYGKVVGYSGRLYENKKDEPKYVNSPFTTIFTKGDVLYNLDRAQAAIKTQKRVILYEGFMDVIASVKSGLKEAVCSMGTALTGAQAVLLRKYAEKVVLCYDGDSAGFEAMQKAIPILENAGLAVSLLILPEDLDPDDYVKKYSEAQYAQYVENNQIDKYEFRYQYMKKHTDFRKAAEIERFKVALFTTLQKEASGTVTEIYLRHLAADAHVDFETIRADFNQYGLSQKVSQSLAEKRTKISAGMIMNKFLRAEQQLVCYYTRAAEYRRVIREFYPTRFCADDRNDEIIVNIDDLLAVHPDADVLTLVPQRFFNQQEEIRQIMTLKKDEYGVQELQDCLNTLFERDVENNVKALERQLSQLDPTADKEQKILLMDRILKEKKRGNEINGKKRNPKKVN
jgi:DNA primase